MDIGNYDTFTILCRFLKDAVYNTYPQNEATGVLRKFAHLKGPDCVDIGPSEYWLTYEQNFIKIGGISLLILTSAVENGLSLPNLTCRFLRKGR